jgi:hypothetical protein
MATYFARKSGNINAVDVWATTPTGTASNLFPTFTNADVLMANNFTVTINVDTTVESIRGNTFGGATNGGLFVLNSGRTLTANVLNGSNYCLGYSQAGTATIIGNVSNSGAISNGTGTLIIIGNVSGATAVGARTDAATATLSIQGNVTGGAQMGVHCELGTVNIDGTITGGTTASIYGVHNVRNGTVNVTNGIVTGGNAASAFGIRNELNGIVNINGIAIGGSGLSATSGVSNASNGNVFLKRAVGNGFGPGSTGLAAAVGLANSGVGFASVEEMEFGTLGMSPVSGGGIRLKKANTNVAVFNYCDTAGAKTLIDATTNAAMPAATDVRSGVSYASGALSGSCAVPAAGSVALGVPVDATTGTAVLTPEAVWGHASRTITGGIVDTATTLTNSPDVPTEAEIASAVWGAATKEITGGTVTTLTNSPDVPTEAEIASQVRTELSVELGRIDAAVSSRLSPSGTLATVTNLTNAPTVPTAAAIADEVRVELATELARLDAPVSGATAPSAATVASAVRSELSTELARVDQAISTRLAGSAYTAPANSDVSAIKAKTDLLETTRLAQCSTVATTGAQLAAALS